MRVARVSSALQSNRVWVLLLGLPWLLCLLYLLVGLIGLHALSGHTHATNEAPTPDEELLKQYRLPSSQWPAAWIDADVAFQELAAMPAAPAQDPAKVALGEQLFFSTQLSRSGTIACASCHQPNHGWSLPEAVAAGHEGRLGRRNPLALHAVGARHVFGWDGRGQSLEEQSLFAITRADEMANDSIASVLQRLSQDAQWKTAFQHVYGDSLEPTPSQWQLSDALAAFQRQLDHPTSLDRFLQGQHEALDSQQIIGLHLFRTKARCANCHFGALLSDDKFHNLKIASFGEAAQDLGRLTMTKRPEDTAAFRTPSLRHIATSAPYMHSGLFDSLEGVIQLYNRGGGEVWARNAQEAANPLYPFAVRISPHIQPLNLTQEEQAALRAFLDAL